MTHNQYKQGMKRQVRFPSYASLSRFEFAKTGAQSFCKQYWLSANIIKMQQEHSQSFTTAACDRTLVDQILNFSSFLYGESEGIPFGVASSGHTRNCSF